MIDAPQACSSHTSFDFQKKLAERYSNYIVYVDESGDQNLTSIDPLYPVFVLAFCIFEKHVYAEVVSPAIRKLKFKYFGHDLIIFHERDIRKAIHGFRFLRSQESRTLFMSDLNFLMENMPFTLVAVAVKKDKGILFNPYYRAMQYGLERVHDYLASKQETIRKTHIIFEARGKREDLEFRDEFKCTCFENNQWKHPLPFELYLADKKINCGGLQVADLVARPIGGYLLNNQQENRAFRILQTKFYAENGRIEGYGLKVFD